MITVKEPKTQIATPCVKLTNVEAFGAPIKGGDGGCCATVPIVSPFTNFPLMGVSPPADCATVDGAGTHVAIRYSHTMIAEMLVAAIIEAGSWKMLEPALM
jgi:hypothetical protein